jgi:hypothetical protein
MYEYEQVFQLPQQGHLLQETHIVLNDDHTIESIEVVGGCNGNLKGISRLLKGMKAEDAIARMEGTTCGPRPTSCPDQIAQNLKRALAEL